MTKERFEAEVMAVLGKLHGVARRLTRHDADAEDLVSETITRAWRARASLEDAEAFRGWIFRILNNTFISERRRLGARLQFEPFEEEPAEDGVGTFSLFDRLQQPFLLWFGNPEQEFLDRVLREDLDRALAELPEHYRVVVVMSDLQEFKYGEIAEALEIPVGTVRSRLARARSALQKLLWVQARERGIATGRAGEADHA